MNGLVNLQRRICHWLLTRFGEGVLNSRQERAARILEEAVELAQAEGVDLALADRIIVRVYGRPAGLPTQEAAGVAVTLLAWAAITGTDLERVTDAEVYRIERLPVDHFRRKHAEKAAAGTALAGTPPGDAERIYAVYTRPECPFQYCDAPTACGPAAECRHRQASA